jgi:putative phosphoserine phosphatase/1-acylglycerol-3-phosphate O-acyltransferase
MSAGIPIVPIVIRNAEVIAARDSSTLNPGTVDVAVFPPISVKDWTVGDLSDRIAEVRQLYVDTLSNWPVDKLPEVSLYGRTRAPAKKVSAKPPAKKVATKRAPAKKAVTKAAPAKKLTTKAAPKAAKAKGNSATKAIKDTTKVATAAKPVKARPIGAAKTARRPVVKGRP